MKRKFFRRLVAITVVAAIAAMSTMFVYAADTTDTGTGEVDGSVSINGTILPLTISVTHELNIAYSIDPNTGSVSTNPISITNSTRVPVSVTVQSLASAPGGTLQFTDVLPSAENWSSLNTDDSKKYIALGLKIDNDTGWNPGYSTSTDWAAADTPVTFGTLPSGATGSLTLVANSGYAFDSEYTAMADVIMVVSLV